jgi:hypothetical protein
MDSNVIFYNRNFLGTVSINLDIEIERYSFSMFGGPEAATLKGQTLADKWELIKLLRCPVEIYGDDGGVKWWGFVNRVVIPHGKLRIGLSLDELYNSVDVKYSAGTVSALHNQSATEYGEKEFFIDLGAATLAEAEGYRNTYLEEHKYPIPDIELSGGQIEIVIECRGWWQTLAWKLYANPSTTLVENAAQIADIGAACGQFINGVVVQPYTLSIDWNNGTPITYNNNESVTWNANSDAGGIASNPYRDGSNTGLAYIMEILNAGSSNARKMLAYVDKNRYIHVYERSAETTEYIMRDDGKLETLFGRLVDSKDCLHAVWARVKGVPEMQGGLSAMRPFFIEHAEYVVSKEEG